MDRTVIVPYRAEEKELSRILYDAIKGLMLLYPPTEDLRKCLSDEMFIKPNQQAFFHVMHYLFRIFDAQEFKKRFFWPITDKRSESSFRNSTVEYLKYINEKYQLNWTNIKSYLVVMPGGMKFISFLIDFLNFVVQELVKQKEKQLNLDANSFRCQVSEANLHKMCAKNEFFKSMASEFIDALENLNAKYDSKSLKLMQHLECLSDESGLAHDFLIDENYLQSFEKSNCQLFEMYYVEREKNVSKMDQLISDLKDAMEKFYSKETGYKYDKHRICQQLKRIRDHFPIDELVEESFNHKITDEGVNINTLVSTFNAINETIQTELKDFSKNPCAGEFVYSRLLDLKKEFQEIEAQITNFKKILNENMKKSKIDLVQTPLRSNGSDSKARNLENTLLMKLVSTPPIKFEVPEGGGKSRLALVDSKCTNDTTFKNFLAPPKAIAIRHANRNHSLADKTTTDLNNTINRSKIIDPMQLLRSSSKKDSSSKFKMATAQLNLSNLGSKWNQHATFLNDKDDDDPITSASTSTAIKPNFHIKSMGINKESPQSFAKTASPVIVKHSPFSPFNSNDRTRIARTCNQLDSSTIGGINSFGSISLNAVKKLSAVTKVRDASLNFANLSTSPSGRLDPLVTADDLDIPKLKLNDISFNEHNLILTNLVNQTPKVFVENFALRSMEGSDENNPYSSSIEEVSAAINNKEEEVLSNISDSVLKDVTL